MVYDFVVRKERTGKHTYWVAQSLKLKGCVGQGDTSDEAVEELEMNESSWLETASEYDVIKKENYDDGDDDYDDIDDTDF